MRRRLRNAVARMLTALALAACSMLPAEGQTAKPAPVTDSSAQASPVQPLPAARPTDTAAQASPAAGLPTGGASIAPNTALPIKLGESVDSGSLTNGQTLHATLSAPVALLRGHTLPAGTLVALTVIEAVPAGRISSSGEFSLQLVRMGSIPVQTDTLTYRGQPGPKDLPDAARATGTDARLPKGAQLTFHVLPPAEPATGNIPASRLAPGSLDARPGGTPAPNSNLHPDSSRRTTAPTFSR